MVTGSQNTEKMSPFLSVSQQSVCYLFRSEGIFLLHRDDVIISFSTSQADHVGLGTPAAIHGSTIADGCPMKMLAQVAPQMLESQYR